MFLQWKEKNVSEQKPSHNTKYTQIRNQLSFFKIASFLLFIKGKKKIEEEQSIRSFSSELAHFKKSGC